MAARGGAEKGGPSWDSSLPFFQPSIPPQFQATDPAIDARRSGRYGTAPMNDTLKAAGVFSDHAVLQRDVPLPVWAGRRPGRP